MDGSRKAVGDLKARIGVSDVVDRKDAGHQEGGR